MQTAALPGRKRVKPVEVAAGLTRQCAGLAVGDHVLVYDLGGGTFDLAVLMRDGGQGDRQAGERRGEASCPPDCHLLLSKGVV